MNTLNVEVNARIVAKNESLFTNYTNLNRTDNNIQIYLSSKLIQEASSRRVLDSDIPKSHVQVNTALYRNPSLFLQANRSLYERRFFKHLNTEFNFLSMNAQTFGDKATLRLMPVLISDVISVDVRNVDMQDLKNPVCIINNNYRQVMVLIQ